MLGAIYTGLSGLNAFGQGLQTVSNNVANLNTLGYKASAASFTDVYSHGGGGLIFFSSTNDSKVGNGVRFGEAQIDFSQGDLKQSEGDLDLAIQGGGFLVLLNDDKTYYTRTGQFAVDKDGYISLQSDSEFRLGVIDSANRASALNIDSQRTYAPAATTTIKFADNLSSSATTATVTDLAVFDALGGKQTWTVKFDKVTGSTNEWTVTVTDQGGSILGTSALKFQGSSVDPSTAKLTVAASPPGAEPFDVVLDFSSGVSSFSGGSTSTLRAASVDGNAVGSLTKVGTDTTGHVQLTYSNGKTETLGLIALADFRDPQQLRRANGGMFVNEGNGPSRVVGSEIEGMGRLLSKQQEASNIDLSQQFGELILIQRGFQASSQVVSVTNDMIQQLFGIRGQG